MGDKVFKVLVVEDEDDIREILAKNLPKRLNVHVMTNRDGSKTVETVRSFKPDVILLDIHLPGHMGWDVLREVRAFDNDVKIVILTALYVVPPEDQEFILQNTSGYMTKPLSLDQIAKKIIELLGQEVVR